MKAPRLLALLLICLLGSHEAKSQSSDGADETKMAKAKAILADLNFIDANLDQVTMDKNLAGGAKVTQAEWMAAANDKPPGSPHLKETGKNIFGESYGDQVAGEPVTIPPKTWAAVKDTSIDWSRFKPAAAK